MAKPGHTNSLSQPKPCDVRPNLVNPPDDLVTGDHRVPVQRQIALDDVNVRSAHRANIYFEPYFAAPGDRVLFLPQY